MEIVTDGPRTEVPQLRGKPAAAVLLLNDDDLTYAKIRLDPGALNGLSTLDSTLARGLCWTAAWDMTRDAELPAREYLRLVCAAMPAETDVNLLTAVLAPTSPAPAKAGQAQIALDLYADPAWSPTGRHALAATALSVLNTTRPTPDGARAAADSARSASDGAPSALDGGGSDPVLPWARAFISVARDADEQRVLRDWLAGRGVPRGLVIDADLRWTILNALVAEGAAGPSEIDAELERDRTDGGERAAATARALVPMEAGKRDVWRRLTEESLPAGLQRALLFGFHHPSQTALTAPYHWKYLEVVDRVWAAQGLGRASEFAVHAYASLLVDPSAVYAADQWLARSSHPAPLRRLVRDGRDNQARALAARAASG